MTFEAMFDEIYYVPVEVADVIDGENYQTIVNAAATDTQETSNNKNIKATLTIYQAWSDAARKDMQFVTYEEAWFYDPSSASTALFDAVAVMLAIQLVNTNKCDID